MRTTLALAFLAAALAAGGCKKADKKADNAPTPPASLPHDPKPSEGGAVKPPDPATPAAGTLKLPEHPPQVGDKETKTDDINVVFQFDAQGKKIDATSVEHKQETTEVLAVDGKLKMKIKVSYSGLSAVQKIGGGDKAKPQPLDGKTYIVWSEGGAIKATSADDKPVSPEELAELADKNDELGKPDVIEQLLAARTWKIGETYQLSADELAKVKARTSDPSKPAPTEMSFTLLAFDDKEAQFAMTTTLVQSAGAESLTFTMKGTARVDRPTSRGTEMAMSGTLAGSVKGMPTTGTMTAKTTYSY